MKTRQMDPYKRNDLEGTITSRQRLSKGRRLDDARNAKLEPKAYAAQSATSALAPFQLQRREVGPHDVQIDILYCGVCHSDLHQVRNEWHNTIYPCVPGHEIVGRVVKSGGEVKKFKEMLDFCAAHDITADVEVIPIQQVNDAYEKMLKGQVRYRFVI